VNQVPTPAVQKEFYQIFKKPVNQFWNVCGFDICRFDEYLGEYPDGTSMKDFIREKYGDRAVELIQSLI
jgi:cyanate lyase